MRVALVLVLLVPALSLGQADDNKRPSRYGYELNTKDFPQDTPEKALKSVVSAIQTKKIGYLLAHLADPAFVDNRVDRYAKLLTGKKESRKLLAFERFAKETAAHFQQDPTLLKELKKIAAGGDWNMQETRAIATYRALPGRAVVMKRLDTRWCLENRQRPAKN